MLTPLLVVYHLLCSTVVCISATNGGADILNTSRTTYYVTVLREVLAPVDHTELKPCEYFSG